MSKKDQNKASSTQGWNTYWQGASSSAQAFTSGGASNPGFPLFWSTPLDDFLSARPNARILDIATGSGAVIESLSQLANTRLENVSCVDISEAAIDGVQRRFPGIIGVVADANSIPLETGQYDLVTSQFGIEYAGPAAIDEAVRLLAPDGSLIFLMHIHDGVLYRECSAAIDALRRTQQCGFIQLARDFFELGFAAVRGADRAAYDDAGLKLNPAIQELEAIISDHGQHVAGDMIEYLLTTVQTIHKRIQYHEPDEVLDWRRLTRSWRSTRSEWTRCINPPWTKMHSREYAKTLPVRDSYSTAPNPYTWKPTHCRSHGRYWHPNLTSSNRKPVLRLPMPYATLIPALSR